MELSEKENIRGELLGMVRSLRAHIESDIEWGSPLSYLAIDGDEPRPELQLSPAAAAERSPAAGEMQPSITLESVRNEIGDCLRCPLGKSRTHIVFGEGSPDAKLVFVGEAPGADEDAQGRPFVGRAGQLLTRIISAMGFARKDVYICNILKCRPPGNRNPKPDEIQACEPFLVKQLQAINPDVVCTLGTFASHTLLKTEVPITALRGRFHAYQGIKLMPTYHPAYLLRNPSAKKQVWEDVQVIMKLLEGKS